MGKRTRFWLPAALAWVGSGALVAFDALELVLKPALTIWHRRLHTGLEADRVLVIGVLAGVVVALAVTAAAKDDQKPAGA
jgi:hypothetical protein